MEIGQKPKNIVNGLHCIRSDEKDVRTVRVHWLFDLFQLLSQHQWLDPQVTDTLLRSGKSSSRYSTKLPKIRNMRLTHNVNKRPRHPVFHFLTQKDQAVSVSIRSNLNQYRKIVSFHFLFFLFPGACFSFNFCLNCCALGVRC